MSDKCHKCGKNKHDDVKNFPANKFECHICKKTGHWATVCRNKNKQEDKNKNNNSINKNVEYNKNIKLI